MSYDVNSLEAHWMPFSANRDFKKEPRIVVKSDGMYMWDYKGGQIIDGSSALFCTPAGHGRREVALLEVRLPAGHDGLLGVELSQFQWYDSGKPLPWLQAQVDHALRRSDLSESFSAWLKKRLAQD